MIELGIWSGIGLLTGLLAGLVPGAGPFVAIGVLYPFLASASGVEIMMCYVAILIATNYTNSVTAILYGIPGDATAIMTAREGHRLFKKGFGSVAVSSNAISSTIGVAFAVLLFFLSSLLSILLNDCPLTDQLTEKPSGVLSPGGTENTRWLKSIKLVHLWCEEQIAC